MAVMPHALKSTNNEAVKRRADALEQHCDRVLLESAPDFAGMVRVATEGVVPVQVQAELKRRYEDPEGDEDSSWTRVSFHSSHDQRDNDSSYWIEFHA